MWGDLLGLKISLLYVIVVLPDVGRLGSFKKLAGTNTQRVSIADLFSFVIILTGAIIYNNNPEIDTTQPQLTESDLGLSEQLLL